MSLKNFAYDHPSYVARQAVSLGAITAGAAGVTGRFTAHANLQIYGITSYTTIAGTSTTTTTNAAPPATAASQVHVNCQLLNLIRIYNTASAGVAPALATATFGPFIAGGSFANGTYTGAVGQAAAYPVNSGLYVGTSTVLPNSSLTNQGGVAVNAGDSLYVVSGTDATAVNVITLDYQTQPLASVQA